LLLFFLAAAVSAPVWGRIAATYGQRHTLMAGMVLAIIAFGFALRLGTGDVLAFAIISAASGAALAADMVLLPALFARHLSVQNGGEAMGFGLWSFASKLTLAFAALTLFPILEARGFLAGQTNTPQALQALTLLYAGLPCVLKLCAIGLLARTPIVEG
jgi:GPH family glycoside/pentoside/hexuronide:cation symporter